jgi:hypothetical protein
MLLWWAVERVRRFVVVVLLASIPAAPAAAGSRVAFNLLTQHGTSFTERDIAGLPTALFFGFTFCPDICASTLMELTNDLEALGADGDRIEVVFVSIDPDRDTQAHLKEYMSSFDRRIVAVSGSPESMLPWPAPMVPSIARCRPDPAIRSTIAQPCSYLTPMGKCLPSSMRGNHSTSDLPNSKGCCVSTR